MGDKTQHETKKESRMGDKTQNETKKESSEAKKDWKIITLKKPVEYQGMEVKEIDLGKLEDLTAQDMNNAYDTYYALGGNRQIMQESTLLFAQIMAAQVTGYQIEVFERMGAKDAMCLKNRVYRFFFLEE